MLHSKIYNESLTPEMLKAFRERDADELRRMVLRYAESIQHKQDLEFREEVAKLHCACALFDALRGGHACALIADFVNF